MLFCVKGLEDDNKQFSINKPIRVLESDNPLSYIDGQECKGHKNIEELRKNCPIWKSYYKEDPLSAQKICEKKFILKKPAQIIITPMDEEFNNVSYKLVKHTIFGELNKDIQGIHLFSTMNKSIKNIAIKKNQDKNGVWVADIEFYSEGRKKTYVKKNSSMFPIHWTPNIFMLKIYFAYKTKKQCNDDSTIYHSTTDCGIRVDFVIKSNKLRTVYPIYEE